MPLPCPQLLFSLNSSLGVLVYWCIAKLSHQQTNQTSGWRTYWCMQQHSILTKNEVVSSFLFFSFPFLSFPAIVWVSQYTINQSNLISRMLMNLKEEELFFVETLLKREPLLAFKKATTCWQKSSDFGESSVVLEKYKRMKQLFG